MILHKKFKLAQNNFIVFTIFLASIYGQNNRDASLSLDQIFFQLNNLKLGTSLDDDSSGSASFSLNLFKIGFKDFTITNNNTITQLNINGPNIELEDL